MEMKKLIILTGPVKSGKTSNLISFIESRNDVGGILSPVIDGKKHLLDISTLEKRLLEADSDKEEKNVVNVGKYKFNQEVFEWANSALYSSIQQNNNFIIIDEIGQLEFREQGLSPAAGNLIRNYSDYDFQLIVVVRDSLIKKFYEYFIIKPDEIDFF